jgi:hypothetical protein
MRSFFKFYFFSFFGGAGADKSTPIFKFYIFFCILFFIRRVDTRSTPDPQEGFWKEEQNSTQLPTQHQELTTLVEDPLGGEEPPVVVGEPPAEEQEEQQQQVDPLCR